MYCLVAVWWRSSCGACKALPVMWNRCFSLTVKSFHRKSKHGFAWDCSPGSLAVRCGCSVSWKAGSYTCCVALLLDSMIRFISDCTMHGVHVKAAGSALRISTCRRGKRWTSQPIRCLPKHGKARMRSKRWKVPKPSLLPLPDNVRNHLNSPADVTVCHASIVPWLADRLDVGNGLPALPGTEM